MRYFAKGRPRKPGEMNGLEKTYSEHLHKLKISGEILDYWFEPMNLKLSKGCYYRPDFMVLLSNLEIEIHETKGKWEDDALVKIKVAAEMFPFRFIAIKKIKGGFDFREVGIDNLTAKVKK